MPGVTSSFEEILVFVLEVDGPMVHARRRRLLLETPAAAKRIWVEDAVGNFYFVKADFGKGPRTVAEHNEVRDTVAQLEAAGCVVENVPKWCRDRNAPLPVTASYDGAPSPIQRVMPVLIFASFLAAGALVVDWFMLHLYGRGLFPH
jgi:hypothetical protein